MSQVVRSTVIRGRRWKFQEVPPSRCVVDGKPAQGYCHYAKMTFAVDNTLTGEERLEVILHEFLHAAYPDLHDDNPGPVYSTAKDLARFLTRLGYSVDKP